MIDPASITEVSDAYSTDRSQLVVHRRRVQERKARVIKLTRRDATEGDVWRADSLWDLTSGVLDMDFVHPETSEDMRVTFVRDPVMRYEFAVDAVDLG